MNVRLLIVDDHPMLRTGLRQAMAQHSHFTVVGEASTGELAVQLALELKPDLVVMDVHLHIMNGLEATRQILSAVPATKILIFSGNLTGGTVDEAMQAGAGGYICKRASAEDLMNAIDGVMAGNICLSPEVSQTILGDYRRKIVGQPDTAKLILSAREKLLLRLVAEGRGNKRIATLMTLSPNSIETYRARLMKKIHCRNTAELVRFAIREGISTL